MELEALQQITPAISALGASLVAVSPQLPKYSSQVVKKLGLTYPVLADTGNGLAARLGLTFPLPPQLIEIYRGFGIDLERFNGDDSWQLALPGRFIVDRGGIIQDVEIHPDYTVRPEPEETVARLRQLFGR